MIMRTILLLSFLLFSLVGCGESNQRSTVNNKIQSEKKNTLVLVKQANKYKLLIDSTKGNLHSVQRDVYESAEGGTVESFYNQSDTIKKEIIYYGEMGKRVVHIYKKQGKTILVEDTNVSYEEPINPKKTVKISSSVTDVYYLDRRQNLIYWIKDGRKMPESRYKAQEEEIILE